MMQDRIFAVFLPRERIKISGCSFEFKSNLNSNANQLIPIHSTHEKREGMASLVHGEFTRKTLSHIKQMRMDKARWLRELNSKGGLIIIEST